MRELILPTRCHKALCSPLSLFVPSECAASGLFDRPNCCASLSKLFTLRKPGREQWVQRIVAEPARAPTLSKLLITIHIRHAYWVEPPLVVVPSPLVYCESACATERSCAWSVYLTGTSLHLWWYQLLWYIVNLPVPLRDYRPSVTTTNVPRHDRPVPISKPSNEATPGRFSSKLTCDTAHYREELRSHWKIEGPTTP
jgi:hypothetical protein